MKTSFYIILLMSILSCQEIQPTYNPFDNQFDVSVRQLIDDNCDKISADCGYYNYTRNYGTLRPYYQIYSDDPYLVIAKGFEYQIDTFRIKQYDVVYKDGDLAKKTLDSIIHLPINEETMNNEFGKYEYQVASKALDTIKIVHNEHQDTIPLRVKAYFDYRIRSVIRGINFYRTKQELLPNNFNG